MIFDLSIADTSPAINGEAGPFSVPPDWQGDVEEYKKLIRDRYASDPVASQRLVVQAWWFKKAGNDVRFNGPYGHIAREILVALANPVAPEKRPIGP